MTMVAVRQEDNRELIRLLVEMVEKHADQRFGQLLINSGVLQLEMTQTAETVHEETRVSDPFYEESWTTLRRVLKTRRATGNR